jgi:hypothetical protein
MRYTIHLELISAAKEEGGYPDSDDEGAVISFRSVDL